MTSRRPGHVFMALAALALIVALGVVLRTWHLGVESLWVDEARSIVQAKRWWRTLWIDEARIEPNPPLYFTLLKVWLRAFGDSEAAARSLSVLFGTLTIGAVFVFGRIAGGTRLALAAAGIAATSPFLVMVSRDVSGFALAILAATICLCGALWLITRLQRPYRGPSDPTEALAWAAYILGAIVAIYTHTALLLLPIVANIAAFIIWVSAPTHEGRFAPRWLLANATVLTAYVPWIPNLLGGNVAAGDFSLGPVSLGAAVQIVRDVYGRANLPLQPLPDVAIAAAAVTGLVALRRSLAALVLILAMLILVPSPLTYLLPLSTPIVSPHAVVWPVAFLAVAIAAGAVAIPNRVLAAGAVLVIMAAQAFALADPRATLKHEPWRDIVERFHRERQPGDVLVLAPSSFAMPFEYYAGRDADVLTVELRGAPRPNPRWSYRIIGADELPTRLAGRRRVWLVTQSEQWVPLSDPLPARIAPGYTLVDDTRMDGLKLRLFAQRP